MSEPWSPKTNLNHLNIQDQFFKLNPDLILKSVDQLGFEPTGELHQLNSYENRVFDIKLEIGNRKNLNRKSIIGKYFRPGRWSKETLQDEHTFCQDLDKDGISLGLPLIDQHNKSVFELQFLHQETSIYYCFYEKVQGRMMQEILLPQFQTLGSLVARVHNTGEKSVAQNRNYFGPSADNKWPVLDQLYHVVSPEVRTEYLGLADHVFATLDENLKNFKDIRIHGDLHRGNLLDNGSQEITLVDFDDFLNGPAVQDFWMIFPDEKFESTIEFELFMKGYEALRHFDSKELKMVPYLRAYRIINYAAWILNRWQDPSFVKIFPEFNTYRYWAEETDSLRKIANLF